MKRTSILLLAAFAALTLTLSDLADAARMGGGRSLGAQRQSVTPSKPAPPATTPAGNANAAGQPATPASPTAAAPAGTAPAPAAAPSGASRWLGPIAGIAAGLGLAALLSHFGLSEGLGSLLLIGLIIFAGVFLVRMLMSRRETAKPLQYAGAVGRDGARPGYENQSRPVWSDTPKIEPRAAPAADAPGLGVTRKALPEGFDAEGFVSEAKRQFIRLQGSYDSADRAALSAVMTPEMYTEIARELDERGPHQATEIVKLDADVLDVSTEGDKHWASVRFTGLVREDGEPVPKSIDEVWNLAKPVRGKSGWLLAGIRQLA
jgi:predicted lipid-binding transport protein (Tim44 family)